MNNIHEKTNPGLEEYVNEKIILFDGVCKLCNNWTNFVLRYDKQKIFKLASVQSEPGQLFLKRFGLPTDVFQSMVFVDKLKPYQKSDAVIRILSQLPYPLRILSAGKWIPKRLRDWGYDRIALNRYRLFGKYEQCVLPTEVNRERFL